MAVVDIARVDANESRERCEPCNGESFRVSETDSAQIEEASLGYFTVSDVHKAV